MNSSTPSAGEQKIRVLSPEQRDAFFRKAVLLRRAKTLCGSHRFSCFLDEQPAALVPRWARQNAMLEAAELLVNPSFRYQVGDEPPDDIRQCMLPLDSFLSGYPLAWVEDAGTGLWMPFWVRGAWTDVLPSLRIGQPVPAALGAAMRQTLAMATILVPRDYEYKQRVQWQKSCQAAQAQFKAQGYAIMRHLIHPLQLGAMRQYYRALVAAGGLPLGDPQVPQRYCLHSEVLANFFHLQLTDLMGRIAGEPVKPSYVYFASYRPGADLPRHVDREQCEFSISLLADYAPDPDGPCGWPLFMEHPRRPAVIGAADLGVGDVVFYRGRELVHYRSPLPAEHQSTSLFLHYVREDFVGRLW